MLTLYSFKCEVFKFQKTAEQLGEWEEMNQLEGKIFCQEGVSWIELNNPATKRNVIKSAINYDTNPTPSKRNLELNLVSQNSGSTRYCFKLESPTATFSLSTAILQATKSSYMKTVRGLLAQFCITNEEFSWSHLSLPVVPQDLKELVDDIEPDWRECSLAENWVAGTPIVKMQMMGIFSNSLVASTPAPEYLGPMIVTSFQSHVLATIMSWRLVIRSSFHVDAVIASIELFRDHIAVKKATSDANTLCLCVASSNGQKMTYLMVSKDNAAFEKVYSELDEMIKTAKVLKKVAKKFAKDRLDKVAQISDLLSKAAILKEYQNSEARKLLEIEAQKTMEMQDQACEEMVDQVIQNAFEEELAHLRATSAQKETLVNSEQLEKDIIADSADARLESEPETKLDDEHDQNKENIANSLNVKESSSTTLTAIEPDSLSPEDEPALDKTFTKFVSKKLVPKLGEKDVSKESKVKDEKSKLDRLKEHLDAHEKRLLLARQESAYFKAKLVRLCQQNELLRSGRFDLDEL